MTLNDAEVSQAVIRRFQRKLASAETLPVRSLRRNSGEYPLVCYINNVTALFVSENWGGRADLNGSGVGTHDRSTCGRPTARVLRTDRTLP